jgi:hypothetical protein
VPPFVTTVCRPLWAMPQRVTVSGAPPYGGAQQFGPGTDVQVVARGRDDTQLAVSGGGNEPNAYRVWATTPAADAALALPGKHC